MWQEQLQNDTEVNQGETVPASSETKLEVS